MEFYVIFKYTSEGRLYFSIASSTYQVIAENIENAKRKIVKHINNNPSYYFSSELYTIEQEECYIESIRLANFGNIIQEWTDIHLLCGFDKFKLEGVIG